MSAPFVCHVEWGTTDPESLRKFLDQLFGWEFHAFTPEYLMHMPAEGGASVGIMKSDQMRAGGSPSASVRVTDIDAGHDKGRKPGRQESLCPRPKWAPASSPSLPPPTAI